MDDIKSLAMEIGSLIDDKKGEDIVMLEVKGLSSIADYFVIATGNTERHVGAIIDNVHEKLRDKGILPISREGKSSGRWVILDYAGVMVHIFHKDERAFYNLERLWNDARKFKLNIDTF